MAKNVSFERNKLVEEVEQILGLKMKRNFGSDGKKGATGGLSTSNESMIANGFAHLLCNEKNFQTVRWLLRVEIAIPPQFQKHYDRASFLYACGTAPRIVMKGSRHVSKDAVKTGLGQEFIMWAQSQRVAGVGGLSGLSASVREGVQFGVVDEYGNLAGAEAQFRAAEDQLAVRKALEFGGELAARQVLKHKDIRAGVKNVLGLQLVAPKSVSKHNKPAVVEPVTATEEAAAPKNRSRSKKQVIEATAEEVTAAPKNRSRSKKQAVGE